ncbi:MAG: hypothetical protein NVS3B18_15070 [Candidatus Dormibacteria bacterium]
MEKTAPRRGSSVPPPIVSTQGADEMRIATTQLWVHDQNEALAFYTQKLGFEIRSDATLPSWATFAG